MTRRCISYPKSGRTWLRRMLEACGHGEAVIFQHDGFEFNDGVRPPHDFSVETRLARYRAGARVVYLDRDPRDVMVSLFHQVTGRFRDFFAYQGSIGDFIRDDYFGAATLQCFRTMWAAILAQRPFLHIGYEQLHADAAGVLARVLDYLDLPCGSARIAAAVEAGRFETMQALEASNRHGEPWLRPRNGFPKMRQGMVGAYRELAPEDIAYLEAIFSSGGGLSTAQGPASADLS